MCVSENRNRDTCCVTHYVNGEEKLRAAIARIVAIAPGDFEVSCSMVVSWTIVKVNVCEQKESSKQVAVLDISQYIFFLLFSGAKCYINSVGDVNSDAGINGEIWVFSHTACHNLSCHDAVCHRPQML